MNIPKGLITNINSIPSHSIIAVSGFGGSGKSTFAKLLGELLDISVISIDSFQKDGAFDSEYKLWEIMDYSRLEKEVLQPFLNNQSNITYGHFDPIKRKVTDNIKINTNRKLIIEGVGLFRPELLKYFTYKIWMDSPLETSIARGKRRDKNDFGTPTDEYWDGIWKKNDLEYIEEYKPKQAADYIFDNNISE